MSNNIVKAGFYGGRFATTRSLYQYDYGIKLKIEGLELPTVFETHFSNGEFDETTTALGRNGVVVIPDIYLTTGKMVYAFIYLHTESDDGETVYRINIPVKKRGKPIDQEATPQEQSTITQAIAELNNAINVSNTNAEYAEGYMNQAHGYSTDAYGYANTASEQAILAGRSAETAEQMKNDAIGAATRASASATIAEDNAVIAVNSANAVAQSAEDAQSSAESAISSATDAAASAQSAHASAQSIQLMTVEATTLTPGSQATAEWSDGTLSLGIPRGDKGLKGDPGDPGDPGFSPTATVSKSGTATTITVTDKNGTTTATVLDGAKGDPGEPGTSPAASVSKSGTKSTITITDEEGTTTAEVLDGSPGIPGVSPTITVTDITGGHRVTITDAEHPGGISFDVMDGSDADAPVKGVTVAGSSIVGADKIAAIPYASTSTAGVIMVRGAQGLKMLITSGGDNTGLLATDCANSGEIKTATSAYRPIVPLVQQWAVFHGLATAAGASMATFPTAPSLGVYPEAQKSAISQMLNGSISVSGTTPTITALPGLRYICGEVSTLTVNLPASGCVDIQFESGSTPTVLTVNAAQGQTVKWANGFDPDVLDADTTYEINIADGLGVTGSWT